MQRLEEGDAELKADGAGFSMVVRRIERTALEELSEFCQQALRISYRL